VGAIAPQEGHKDTKEAGANAHKLTGVIARHGANITSVDIIEERQTYFEIEVTDEAAVIEDLSKLPIVRSVTQVKTFQTVFGKRIIIHGWRRAGGAGRHRRDFGSGPAQYPRRAHLGGHDPAGGRAAAGRCRAGLRTAAPE
jgi:hypothetical protein